MKDRYQTNDRGIRALAEGHRKVAKCCVAMNGDKYTSSQMAKLEGQTVLVRVLDYLASEYSIKNPETYATICKVEVVSKWNQPPKPLGIDTTTNNREGK